MSQPLSPEAARAGMLERVFKLREHGTTARTEVIAGFTTFLTMVYIVFVNPQILGAAGMDTHAVFVTTCLIAAEKDGVLGDLVSNSGGGKISTAQACQMAGKVTLKLAKRELTKTTGTGDNMAAKVWSFFNKSATANQASDLSYKRLMALDACKGL